MKYKEPYEKPKQKLIKKQPHEHGDMTKAKTLIRNFSSNRPKELSKVVCLFYFKLLELRYIADSGVIKPS